jgi:2-succinyl-5-enolpyruvyl-6-hydroxy-3-cyclohexene-1-carboxylate synthase
MTVTVQATFAATLVDEWVRGGVTDAVVAPGSRSTPLALALAGDERIRTHVFLDERSGAFFAVGLGQASARPAVVLTTSGTAAAELHPALVEADAAGIPVIACTADRPSELHRVGAPQTIEQVGLFPGVTRWSADVDGASMPPTAWRSLAARSVAEAVGRGPVHLNLAFRDPLVGAADVLPEGRSNGRPWHEVLPAPATDVEVSRLRHVADGRRGVIVAGAGCGDRDAVEALAQRLQWPLLADPRSGCRTGADVVVAAFDPILRSGRFQADVVIRLGAPPASKVLAQWLASSGAEQVLVDPVRRWLDPERTAGLVLQADPTALCWAGAEELEPSHDGEWLSSWQRAEAHAHDAIETVLASHPEATEPGVARALTDMLGPDATLFVSSSMPVRDVEWFGSRSMLCRVLSNRGTNGIDGVVSTALGVAAAEPEAPTVALIGDLAFLHDVGGLLWARRREVDCAFVVVDNDGGGIFSFLPQAASIEHDRFEQLFGTPHGIDLTALAEAHDIPVRQVDKVSDLASAMEGDGARMVHVRTDRGANVAVHREIEAAVSSRLG